MFEYIEDLGLTPARPYACRKETNLIVLHHFASDASVEAVHRYHISRGHRGIDYNIVVLLDGRAVWGRGLETEGGHVRNGGKSAGINACSIGIACQGNFEERTMPIAQKQMLLRVVWDCLAAYPSIRGVIGHRETADTACPGRYFPLDEAKKGGAEKKEPRIAAIAAAKGRAAVYAKADKKSRVLLPLGQGNRMDVLGISGSFYRVRAAGKEGYVSGNRVDIVAGVSGTPGPVFELGRYLRRAWPLLRGEDVRKVQLELNEQGFAAGTADGIFGSKTAAAVRRFQKAAGLEIDGIVGEKTVCALGGVWKSRK